MIMLTFKLIFGIIKFIAAIFAIIIGCCFGVMGFLILACIVAALASIYSP